MFIRADDARVADVVAHRHRHGKGDARIIAQFLEDMTIDIADRQPLQQQRAQHQLLATAFGADDEHAKGVAGADDAALQTLVEVDDRDRERHRQRHNGQRNNRLDRTIRQVAPGKFEFVHSALYLKAVLPRASRRCTDRRRGRSDTPAPDRGWPRSVWRRCAGNFPATNPSPPDSTLHRAPQLVRQPAQAPVAPPGRGQRRRAAAVPCLTAPDDGGESRAARRYRAVHAPAPSARWR